MSNRKRYITIDQFIRDICVGLGDNDFKKYQHLYRLLVNTVADELEFMVPNVKDCRVEVLSNFTAQMPDDCITPFLVAQVLSDGISCRLIGRRDKVERLDLVRKNFECPDSVTFFSNADQQYHLRLDSNFGENHDGRRSVFYTYYEYDTKNNCLIFNNSGELEVGEELTVNYRAEYLKEEDALIDKNTARLARALLLKEFYLGKPDRHQYWQRQVIIQRNNYKTMQNNFSLWDYINAWEMNQFPAVR